MDNKHNNSNSQSKINEMTSKHEKFFEDIKPEDENLNKDITSYTNPENRTNDKDLIKKSMNEANEITNHSDEHEDIDHHDQYFVSSFPNSSSTGMMQ